MRLSLNANVLILILLNYRILYYIYVLKSIIKSSNFVFNLLKEFGYLLGPEIHNNY